MNNTVGTLISRIQSLYSKGVASDDSRLSDRHIYHTAISIRNKLIVEKRNKKQNINIFNYETIDCVEMTKASISECPCLPVTGCVFLRSKHKIPKILNDLDSLIISQVTDLNGNNVFAETTIQEKKYKKGSKYTSKKPDFFIHNEYLFLSVEISKAPKVVLITAIFKDPEEVLKFKNICATEKDCDDCGCNSMYDKEFKLDDDLYDPLIKMCVQELIQIFNQSREDISNDSKDSLTQETK